MSRPKKITNNEINKTTNKKHDTPTSDQDLLDDYMIKKCRIIGANIRYERKIRRFSIEDLAEYLELSPSYVGLLERGERCPSLKSLLKVCELFGSTPNDFFLEKNDTSGKVSVSEGSRTSLYQNKLRTVYSLLQKLSDSELDFIIGTMKNLKNLNKATTPNNNIK